MVLQHFCPWILCLLVALLRLSCDWSEGCSVTFRISCLDYFLFSLLSFNILLCFRWLRSRTGVLPAPTAQPTSSGTTGPRTSTEWDSRAWWATPITIHKHKRLQLTGLCVAPHPPAHTHTAPHTNQSSHKLGFFIRAMCRAAIVRGSWMSYLHDKRNLSPFCLFTRERESTWRPKAKRAMGVVCRKRASVIEVIGCPFIGC